MVEFSLFDFLRARKANLKANCPISLLHSNENKSELEHFLLNERLILIFDDLILLRLAIAIALL